jgi:hypothetical protein
MTTARTLRLASLAIVLCAITVSAQQAPAPPAFRFERSIVAEGAGPRRLPVDMPLLVGAAPFRPGSDGLRDLRIYDSNGREVGYLLVSDPPGDVAYKPADVLPVASVDTKDNKTSGFEADASAIQRVDRFRIEGLRPPFLKRIKLEASGDRQRWTLLVDQGTVFDLPDERLRLVELRFTAGAYRYFRVTWDDTNSGRLPQPHAAAVGVVPPNTIAAPPLTAPLVFERRPSEPGLSRFRIRLPAGNMPIAKLHLDVGGGHIRRGAKVFEARLSGGQLMPVLLGSTTLTRVVRDGLAAADLHIDIERPTEAQLDIEVDDGDNPPLELSGIAAEFVRLPWIYFEAPATAATGLTARYGNPTLTAPRYDLEAARDQLRIDTIADAKWSEARTRSERQDTTPAPSLPTVGASLDPSQFTYVRGVAPGNAGLVSLALDANVLAHSAGPGRGFADLRIVDGSDRQIPYIVEHTAEPLSLDLALERVASPPRTLPPARAGRSVYRVKYPLSGLPPTRLVLATSARVFQRQVMVAEEREPDDGRRRDPWLDTIASARWIHADQDKPATALTLAVRPPKGSELLVIVDEGDNTPLPITSARALLPAYRLRLFRAADARLRVAYGRTDLSRPQYDLALLAPQLLGSPAADVALDAEQPSGATSTAVAIVSPRLFWVAMTIAVVVLIGLIARLLKRDAGTH